MNNKLDRKTAFKDTLPTVLSAIISKNLLVIVITGIISLAIVRYVM